MGRRLTFTLRGGVGYGRTWDVDKRRILSRAGRGRSVMLYRGVSGGRNDRVGPVRKGQSWATTPQMAIEFAAFRSPRGGGVLHSVKVPASEFRNLGRRHVLQSEEYDALDTRISGTARWRSGDQMHQDDWSVMRDYGTADSNPDRLEVRPNRDRPDLRPKLAGWTGEDGDWVIRRRLGRRRGGIATRGGGA